MRYLHAFRPPPLLDMNVFVICHAQYVSPIKINVIHSLVLLALYDRSFEGEFWAIYSPKGRHWILKLTENDLKKLKVQLRLPSKSASTSEVKI